MINTEEQINKQLESLNLEDTVYIKYHCYSRCSSMIRTLTNLKIIKVFNDTIKFRQNDKKNFVIYKTDIAFIEKQR